MNDFKTALVKKEEAAIAPRQQTDIAKVSKEIEAAVIMANKFPRDELVSYRKIMNSLTRPSLAEKAIYSFPRGGQRVEGPSIRMAETMARAWKNLQYGLREVQRLGGASLMEAYCWDLESNVRITKEFTVNHIRDTKKGAVVLNNERDIYEMVANQGSRRVRACILACIPDDIREDAVDEANKTMLKSAQGNAQDIQAMVRAMIEKFKEFSITKEMVEKFVGNKAEACSPQQIIKLGKIYNSIKEGVSIPADWFEMPALQRAINEEDKKKELENLEAELAKTIEAAKGAGVAQDLMDKLIARIAPDNLEHIKQSIDFLKKAVGAKLVEPKK